VPRPHAQPARCLPRRRRRCGERLRRPRLRVGAAARGRRDLRADDVARLAPRPPQRRPSAAARRRTASIVDWTVTLSWQ
jgi:hypothetical protein